MSYAEVFLLIWAVSATVLLGFLWSLLKKAVVYTRNLSNLVCELVVKDPDAKITELGNNHYTVENDSIKMTFERRAKCLRR